MGGTRAELWRGSEAIARVSHAELRAGRARVAVRIPAEDLAGWQDGCEANARWLLRAQSTLEGPPAHCVQNKEPRAQASKPGEATCHTRFDTLSELVHVDPDLQRLVFAEIGASYATNAWVAVRWRRL